MPDHLDKVFQQNPELQAIGSQVWEHIQRNSGWAIGIGVLLVLFGVIALATPLLTGVSVSIMVGVLLAMSGVAQLVFAAKAGHQFWSYVMGVLSVAMGFYMASHPIVAVGTLTIILAFFLFAVGFSEVMMAWQVRPAKGWLMTLISGLLSIVLGVMIWGQFPLAGALAIGVLFGIKLLFSGMALIGLGSAARKALREAGNRVPAVHDQRTV